MAIVFALVARDPSLILCEHTGSAAFTSAMRKEAVNQLPDAELFPRDAYRLTSTGGEYVQYTLSEVIMFSCVCESSISENKAFRFLHEVKEKFSTIYKGNLQLVHN